MMACSWPDTTNSGYPPAMTREESPDLIAATDRPRTRAGLAADLAALGVAPGMALMVHCALRSLGWVAGGPEAVIGALMDAVGPDGTLMMPAFTGQISDPADWRHPPVPAGWLDAIRAEMPLFDPARTPSRDMGAVAELFRTWPEVRRSAHPQHSVAAWGRHAARLIDPHPLIFGFGNTAPLGRFYEVGGHVLLLGVGYNRNTSLHLAESRAAHGRRGITRFPVLRDGERLWQSYAETATDSELFTETGAAFEASLEVKGHVRLGKVGSSDARLMAMRELVDFAEAWFEANLPAMDG